MNVKWMAAHDRPALQGTGIVIIKDGKKESIYAAIPVASDWGEGWELRKLVWYEHKGESTVTDVYHVNLDGERSTCDCIGFLQYQHCKHVDSLLELQKERDKR